MQKGDLRLRFNDSSDNKEFYSFEFFYDENIKTDNLYSLPKYLTSGFLARDSMLGSFILDTLLNDKIVSEILRRKSSIPPGPQPFRFFIEILDKDLYGINWEQEFANTGRLLFLNYKFIRSLSNFSSVSTLPFTLPVDVLFVEDNEFSWQPYFSSTDVLKNFRTTFLNLSNVDNQEQKEFDIVCLHLSSVYYQQDKQGFIVNTYRSLSIDELVTFFIEKHTKLAILHVDRNYREQSYATELILGHELLHHSGITIIIKYDDGSRYSRNFYAQLFLDITHDLPVDNISIGIDPSARPVFLMPEGGADVLRISPLRVKLATQYEIYSKQATDILSSLESNSFVAEQLGASSHKKIYRKHISKLKDILNSSVEKFSRDLNYSRETGGLVPLHRMQEMNEDLRTYLKEAEDSIRRVVNCWFTLKGALLDVKQNLDKDSIYTFHLQIGPPQQKSMVKNKVAFPDEELAPLFKEEGISLNVILFTSDFELEQTTLDVLLPKPPASTKEILVSLRPLKKGLLRMRANIYYKQNLLQSILVKAVVDYSAKDEKGIEAEVDYSLGNSLEDVERLSPRALNIALNEGEVGTHSLFIAGKNINEKFDFGEGLLGTLVKQSRNSLQNICSTRDSKGRLDSYRFDKYNKGNSKNFCTDIIQLAQFGFELYFEIITCKKSEFADQLTSALKEPCAKIQVASTKSATYIFPWALVYDKRLASDAKIVCTQFLSDLENITDEDFIQNASCIAKGCPNKDDINVICPSGFWGFKHIIEQPLSIDKDDLPSKELVLTIQPSNTNSVLMAVSLELDKVNDHYKELSELSKAKIEYADNRDKIGLSLPKQNHDLIYFYCHGGRDGPKTWLGVGKDQKILPTDLKAWDVSWQKQHPFIFINGCHTVDVTPDDLVAFNRAFSYSQAAGVMGTEISITEIFACYFASEFFQKFLSGKDVGNTVREIRLTLLKKYNLLGLAYTPYCYASLKIQN